jgi:hypothetical protein
LEAKIKRIVPDADVDALALQHFAGLGNEYLDDIGVTLVSDEQRLVGEDEARFGRVSVEIPDDVLRWLRCAKWRPNGRPYCWANTPLPAPDGPRSDSAPAEIFHMFASRTMRPGIFRSGVSIGFGPPGRKSISSNLECSG